MELEADGHTGQHAPLGLGLYAVQVVDDRNADRDEAGPLVDGQAHAGRQVNGVAAGVKPLLAALALGVMEVLLNLGGENPRLEVPAAVLTAAVIVVVATRFGLLTLVSMRYFMLLLTGVAPSFDFSFWYAAFSLPALALLLGLALYAFRISIGEQRIFGSALLEEGA